METRGKILKVKKNYETEEVSFTIHNGVKKINCKFNGFLPVEEGDIISCKGCLEEEVLYISEKPFVLIPTNEENLKKCFLKAIKAKGVGVSKVDKLYEELYSKHSSPNRNSKIINFLNQLTDPFPSDYKFESLTKIQSSKLLNWWKKNFSRRRLYLLGLFDSEIKSSHMSEGVLYDSIKENPFKVCSVSIDKALELNTIFGKDTKQEDVICGQISRYLFSLIKGGWTGCPYGLLVKKYPETFTYKNKLEDEFELVFSQDLVYTHRSFKVELETATRINNLIKLNEEKDKLEKNLPKFEVENIYYDKEDIILTEEQCSALKGGLSNFVSIITGGAGCGKTTLIKQLIKNFIKKEELFMLTSFTGKAVMRIKESLGKEFENISCQTLHMLIHKKRTHQYVDKFYNLIIDESSMVSTDLIWEFFNLYTHKFRIILIGDCNQLSPIGSGSFFSQLIESGRVPVFRLTKNKRTNSNGILNNANGLVDPSRDKKEIFNFTSGEGFYLKEGNLKDCINIIHGLFRKNISIREITVLSPYNKDIENIVKTSQIIFLKDNNYFDFKGIRFYIGDRVMQTKNVYNDEYDLMNGEEGYIIDMNQEYMTVDFGSNKIVKYQWIFKENKKQKKSEEDDYDSEKREFYVSDLKHSFCKTVHKSQGSEYKYVILYLPLSSTNFINTNLLYTAITRAKEKIWIVYDKITLDNSTINFFSPSFEKLSERLKDMEIK